MSLMQLLAQAQGGRGLGDLGQALGLDAATTEALAGQLAPAISGGVKRRAQAEGGLGAVLGALQGERSARYYDEPAAAIGPEAKADGAAFLSSILGGDDAAPQLARAAAERTGAPVEKAEQMLPALAAMLQGGMQRQAPDREIEMALNGVKSAGADRAGSGLGDLMGMLNQGGGGALGGLMSALGGGGQGGGNPLGGVMNALSGGGGGGGQQQAGGGLAPLLQMLDADGDASPLDDVLGMIMK